MGSPDIVVSPILNPHSNPKTPSPNIQSNSPIYHPITTTTTSIIIDHHPITTTTTTSIIIDHHLIISTSIIDHHPITTTTTTSSIIIDDDGHPIITTIIIGIIDETMNGWWSDAIGECWIDCGDE